MFWVDIPVKECVESEDTSWTNLAEFDTKLEAIQFIREYIGPCDDNGNICLISEGRHDFEIQ